MKIAPLHRALSAEKWVKPLIIHTGQHYDHNMSEEFFMDLDLPKPDVHLGVGSATHAVQTGMVMIEYERLLMKDSPDLVIVVGDVNSTMACTLAAVKLGIRVAHLEAGLRSFDRSMPEEINRIVTDSLADVLWTPSPDANRNLKNEGIASEKVHLVGNIMIDSLVMMKEKIERDETYAGLKWSSGEYGVVTLHRPSTVDDPARLRTVCETLCRLSQGLPIVFPVHPRTRKRLWEYGLASLLEGAPSIELLDPLGYISFMSLVHRCRMVITDSGGLQEETTYLGIPCLTLRPNTERPVTITQGTNRLCDLGTLEDEVRTSLNANRMKRSPPEGWDGHTAERITTFLRSYLNR